MKDWHINLSDEEKRSILTSGLGRDGCLRVTEDCVIPLLYSFPPTPEGCLCVDERFPKFRSLEEAMK